MKPLISRNSVTPNWPRLNQRMENSWKPGAQMASPCCRTTKSAAIPRRTSRYANRSWRFACAEEAAAMRRYLRVHVKGDTLLVSVMVISDSGASSPCSKFCKRIHCHFRSIPVRKDRHDCHPPPKWRKSHGMNYDPANPLIVQGDRTVLVEVDNPKYAEARDALAPFAELEKSPEHIHTYRLSDLSLWNAAAAGLTADDMIVVLQKYSKFPVPMNLLTEISERVERYGRVKLVKHEDKLKLICKDKPLLEELARQP